MTHLVKARSLESKAVFATRKKEAQSRTAVVPLTTYSSLYLASQRHVAQRASQISALGIVAL